MRTEVFVALLVVMFIASVLLVLLCYLIARKHADNRLARQLEELTEEARPAMFAYLIHGKTSGFLDAGGSPAKIRALEMLLDSCADVMSGEEATRRIASYATSAFTAAYRANLISRQWSVRMNTLYRIERFGMTGLAPELAKFLDRDSDISAAELAQICKTLAGWGDEALLRRLKNRPPALPEFQRRLILSRMSDGLFNRFMQERMSYPRDWQLAAVDVIGILRKLEHADTLQELLGHEEAEFRIRALKALCELPVSVDGDGLLRHAESADWQERAMAARLFGRIRHAGFLPSLQAMLSDGSWYVRSQAAQSICAFPDGQPLLRHIAEHGSDRFARDMAAEWAERGLENG